MNRTDRLIDRLMRNRRDRATRGNYDSRGAILTDHRMNDMARRGGYNDRNYSNYNDRQPNYSGRDSMYEQQMYPKGNRDYEPMGQYDGGTRYPFMVGGEFSRYDAHYGPYPMGYPMYGDMRGDMRNDRNSEYGDYGESLGKEELEKWNKKLMREIDEQYKHYFSKDMIAQKASQLGIHFDKFNEEELATATAMVYTDYCETLKPLVGTNMDIYIKLARDWLVDPDAAIKGGEKLAVYHDCIVKGEDD